MNHEKKFILIDVRENDAYRKFSAKDSLSLRVDNIGRFGEYFLDSDTDYVFVIDSERDLPGLVSELSTDNFDYILVDDIPQEDSQSLNELTSEEFLNRNKGDYQIVDLRLPDSGVPLTDENAINIPLEELVDKYDQIDKEKDLYLICRTGNRATVGGSYLKNKGYNPTIISDSVDTLLNLNVFDELL